MLEGGEFALSEWRVARIDATNRQLSFLVARHRQHADKIVALVLFERKLEELDEGEVENLSELLNAASAHPGRRAQWQLGTNGGRAISRGIGAIAKPAEEEILSPMPSTSGRQEIEFFQSELRAYRDEVSDLGHARDILADAVELLATSLLPDAKARDVGIFVDAALSTLSKVVASRVNVRRSLTAANIRTDVSNWLKLMDKPNRWTMFSLTETIGRPAFRGSGPGGRIVPEDFERLTIPGSGNGIPIGTNFPSSAETAIALMLADADRRAELNRAVRSATQKAKPWWRRIRIRF